MFRKKLLSMLSTTYSTTQAFKPMFFSSSAFKDLPHSNLFLEKQRNTLLKFEISKTINNCTLQKGTKVIGLFAREESVDGAFWFYDLKLFTIPGFKEHLRKSMQEFQCDLGLFELNQTIECLNVTTTSTLNNFSDSPCYLIHESMINFVKELEEAPLPKHLGLTLNSD